MLSQLDIKTNKLFQIWTAITLFTALFAAVYEYFSFGVYSPYMIFAFLSPLLFGVIPSLLVPKVMGRGWTDGILLLTGGSILIGIFEIYGTSSVWPHRIMMAGILFMILELFAVWLRERV